MLNDSAMQNFWRSVLGKTSYVKQLLAGRDQLQRERASCLAEKNRAGQEKEKALAERDKARAEREQYKTWMPPGHPLSPIPSAADVAACAKMLLNLPTEIQGVNLNEENQLKLFYDLKKYYDEQPFTGERNDGRRYYFENAAFSYADGIFLYCMMRRIRPQRIVEVGSGYSSCVMLDTNELFFDDKIKCTFIEPNADLLRSLLKDKDIGKIEIIEKRVQDVDERVLLDLSAGDILFIDSSHVSKTGSDVNYLFFNILPRLKSGVHVQVHDIFYPFEYPTVWGEEGRAWNETFLMRAFLQYNDAFEIELFTSFLADFHKDKLRSEMPLCMKNTGGSMWLKKL